MKRDIVPPDFIRNSSLFKTFMEKIGTRIESKVRNGWSPADIAFRRGWEIGNTRIWYDADYHE